MTDLGHWAAFALGHAAHAAAPAALVPVDPVDTADPDVCDDSDAGDVGDDEDERVPCGPDRHPRRVFEWALHVVRRLEARVPDPRALPALADDEGVPEGPPPLPPPPLMPPEPEPPAVGIAAWGAIVEVPIDEAEAIVPAAPVTTDAPPSAASASMERAVGIGEVIAVLSERVFSFVGDTLFDPFKVKVVDRFKDHALPLISLGHFNNLATQLHVTRQQLSKHWTLLAASSWLLWLTAMRVNIKQQCESVRSQGGTNHTIFIGRRADETPQKLTLCDSEVFLRTPVVGAPAAEMDAFKRVMHTKLKDVEPCKLLNTEYTVSTLSEVGQEFALLTFTPPTPYQPMTKTMLLGISRRGRSRSGRLHLKT